MERARQALRAPENSPRPTITLPHCRRLEQTIVGADKPSIVSTNHQRSAPGADTGIDNAQNHDIPWQLGYQRGEQIGRRLRLETGRVGHQVDDWNIRGKSHQLDSELSKIRPLTAKIRECDDHPVRRLGMQKAGKVPAFVMI